jgi:hypothetical protein
VRHEGSAAVFRLVHPAGIELALPFRLLGLCVRATFALLGAILFLPARLLGYRPAAGTPH